MLTPDEIGACWDAACKSSVDPPRFDASVYGHGPLEYHGAKDRLLQFARAVEIATRRKIEEEHAVKIRGLQASRLSDAVG